MDSQYQSGIGRLPQIPQPARHKSRAIGTVRCLDDIELNNSLADMVVAILRKTDDFTARSSDELSLAKGDRVELLERDDEFGDGWFLGKHLLNPNSGLFPEGMSASLLPSTHRKGGGSFGPGLNGHYSLT